MGLCNGVVILRGTWVYVRGVFILRGKALSIKHILINSSSKKQLSVSYLDTIENGKYYTIDFAIVNFPYLFSPYGVYISQLVRIGRITHETRVYKVVLLRL